jgi:hypothetical protein
MTDPARKPTTCDQCGQTDDHPKVHGSTATVQNIDGVATLVLSTKHYDCLSAAEEAMERESAQEKGAGAKVSAVIDAAKGGTRGEKLIALIESGKLPQAEGLYQKNQGK